MANEAIRWGIVGLGMGRGRAKMVTETPGAELSAVCDINRELASEVADELGCRCYTDFDDILNDPEIDVVFTLTPSGLHMDQCMAALDAGKHAVTTKPMDVSSAKCREAIQAASRAGRVLAVDFGFRYSEIAYLIRESIDRGLLGRLILGEARLKWYRSQDYYDAGGWRGTWKMDGGGSLANQTVHQLDLLLWFMGKPKRVRAQCGIFSHQIETEDLGMAMLEFENGAYGAILGTTTFPQNAYSGIEIHGEKGAVVAIGDTKWYFRDPEDEKNLPYDYAVKYPHKNIIEDIGSAVRSGTRPLCDGEEGLRTVELLEALYRSSREKTEVEI